MCPDPVSDIASFVSAFDATATGKGARKKAGAGNGDEDQEKAAITLDTLEEFLGRMAEIRQECAARGLVPMYHYTLPVVSPFIFAGGLRMSESGPGDGGVYFSSRGPASYDYGGDDYETNLLTDVFGEDKVRDFRGKHKADLVVVYGAEPRCLRQVPGYGESSKMLTKVRFFFVNPP